MLSPIKPKRYFDGELTDGKRCLRLIGFDKSQQTKLDSFYNKGLPVLLRNCELKIGRSKHLEIIVKNYTHVELSPTKFAVEDLQTLGTTKITLDQLDTLDEYDKVSVEPTVIQVSDPVTVSTGKQKQEITIADAISTATLTLWESDIGKLQLCDSYHLNKAIVRTFQSNRFLSFPSSGASMQPIPDIGEVKQDLPSSDDETIDSAEVIAVPYLKKYRSCLKCKGKVDPADDKILGTCTKCGTMQRLSKCNLQLTANIVIQSSTSYYTFQAFGDFLQMITNQDEVTREALIKAPQFTLTYSTTSHAITGITR